ncbi:hypothetical protein CC86DRAFT_200181 [Ophiobolus disseminans]|uniref:Uncharacterized protein n=1 Tax=Ophiobolus disseminans TaxID=1469910 RepID=A0A6A7A3S8_9PLEO|nr:hypothetical protein CC86DRAFT_200181 [Ophiobolus disseminans]
MKSTLTCWPGSLSELQPSRSHVKEHGVGCAGTVPPHETSVVRTAHFRPPTNESASSDSNGDHQVAPALRNTTSSEMKRVTANTLREGFILFQNNYTHSQSAANLEASCGASRLVDATCEVVGQTCRGHITMSDPNGAFAPSSKLILCFSR